MSLVWPSCVRVIVDEEELCCDGVITFGVKREVKRGVRVTVIYT